MKEGTEIVDHLNVFNTLICQLSSMDVKIDDEDKAVNLLCTLPESCVKYFLPFSLVQLIL